MASCVIFSATIISQDREFVLRRFLETFKSKFSDSDFYIGINSCSIPNLESIIIEYDLNVQMTRTLDSLYTNSDASAYQAALKLLYLSGKKYDTYWFVHTKSGVNSHSDYLREWYIDNFLNLRNNVESFIKTEKVGSYGILGLEFDPNRNYNETDSVISLWENKTSIQLPYTHAHFFYIHSIYALASSPMDVFFSLVTEEWFSSKLDRYYFEGIFPFIVSRSGYFPYLENGISMNGIDLTKYQSEWLVENLLESNYTHLINKFKTKYQFNQLTPPYASSHS